MKKTIHTSGKRKSAIARATLYPGTGKITVNQKFLDTIHPKLSRLKIREPLMLSGEIASKIDVNIDVHGGGFISQAEAARVAVGRALVEFSPELKDSFLEYDRQLLIADVRRKEPRKPNCHGKARAKVQKSYR